MKYYQSHKIVEAAKIVAVDASDASGIVFLKLDTGEPVRVPPSDNLLARHKGLLCDLVGMYLVRYADGYLSISPAKAFEDGYMPLDTSPMTFGDALRLLKAGRKVAREGWNGKGMFLFLVPGSTFQVSRLPLLGIYPEGTTIQYQPHIDMKTAQDTVVPWLASQSDVLANDWVLVP